MALTVSSGGAWTSKSFMGLSRFPSPRVFVVVEVEPNVPKPDVPLKAVPVEPNMFVNYQCNVFECCIFISKLLRSAFYQLQARWRAEVVFSSPVSPVSLRQRRLGTRKESGILGIVESRNQGIKKSWNPESGLRKTEKTITIFIYLSEKTSRSNTRKIRCIGFALTVEGKKDLKRNLEQGFPSYRNSDNPTLFLVRAMIRPRLFKGWMTLYAG